jgi:hypothetical protein
MTAIRPESPAKPASRTPYRFLSSGALVRAVVLALLLTISSLAVFLVGAQESTPDATPTAEPTPSPQMPQLELELEELNDSGIGGTVTLYDAGDETIVEFDVEGAGEDHPTHIHEGVCGELEPEPAFLLENINEDGESTTVVDFSLSELLAEDYAIDMHLASNQLGTLIACVDIDGEPELPPGATPSASPAASPGASPEATPADGTGGIIANQAPTPTEETSDGTGGATETQTVAQAPVATKAPVEAETPVPTRTPVPTPAKTPTMPPAVTTRPADDTDGTGGATTTVPQQPPAAVGDGTAGVSGKGTPVETTTLPQQAGVGAALEWPDSPATAAMWASALGSIVLAGSAWIIRRGERQSIDTPSRWTRMGI